MQAGERQLKKFKVEMEPLYEPLDASKHQIRLLKLVSQSTEERLCVSMKTFDFENVPVYKALSYEWGPKVFETIVVNDHRLSVRQNLFAFLEIFRKRNDDSYIWIDQISINQEDFSERSAQVAMMHRIYSGAKETFLWLGNDEKAALGLSLIAEIAIDQSVIDDYPATIDLSDEDISALHNFYTATYWQRLWVAQEIALSDRRTVLLGNAELDWKTIFDHRNYVGEQDSLGNLPLESLIWFVVNVDHLRKLEEQGYSARLGNMCEVWHMFTLVAAGTQCEDPRDKIYGMQGLLSPELRIEVDYSKPCRDLFIDATRVYSKAFACYVYEFFKEKCQMLAHGMRLQNLEKAWCAAEAKHLISKDAKKHTRLWCRKKIDVCPYLHFDGILDYLGREWTGK